MDITIKSKLWIEANGKPVFGAGRKRLLEAIDKCGSINQAAREINISFRKAWGHLNIMEERLGMKLIERRTGGKGGGGTTLTGDAKKMLEKYRKLERLLQKNADNCFHKIFTGDAL